MRRYHRMTTTPETTKTTAADDTPHIFLAGLGQQGDYAYGFAKAGQQTEALEHAAAIERLIAAYRDAIHVDQPGVVGIELVVQMLDKEGRWQDWRAPLPGLFLEDGQRQLAQARRGIPEREFRLIRRTTIQRVEEITAKPVAGGAE
jgi:hypothetical protein